VRWLNIIYEWVSKYLWMEKRGVKVIAHR